MPTMNKDVHETGVRFWKSKIPPPCLPEPAKLFWIFGGLLGAAAVLPDGGAEDMGRRAVKTEALGAGFGHTLAPCLAVVKPARLNAAWEAIFVAEESMVW